MQCPFLPSCMLIVTLTLAPVGVKGREKQQLNWASECRIGIWGIRHLCELSPRSSCLQSSRHYNHKSNGLLLGAGITYHSWCHLLPADVHKNAEKKKLTQLWDCYLWKGFLLRLALGQPLGVCLPHPNPWDLWICYFTLQKGFQWWA